MELAMCIESLTTVKDLVNEKKDLSMEEREREKKEYVCSYRVGLERKKIVIKRKRERERECVCV